MKSTVKSTVLLSKLKNKLGEMPLRHHAEPVHVRDNAVIGADRAEALVWQTVGGVREESATTARELMSALDRAHGASTAAAMTGTGFAGPAVRAGGELKAVRGITVQPGSRFAVILEVQDEGDTE